MSGGQSTFVVEGFARAHTKRPFVCGNAVLERYWRERAHQDMRRDVATVFTLLDKTTEAIVGYYSLSAASVGLANLPTETQGILPSYPQVPVVLLGRLAVATIYQHRGLGAMLVYDAASRVRRSGVGCFALVTDPIDGDAQALYVHLGFQMIEGVQGRLFAPIASLA